ncbi:LURP-one-related/scramblase family protein [Peptoniphilus sp.]|jgi:uncharacterized protein YxjI|uniref:LURP-one-related/scramblase family protein n=1 Tax=Peptoniphilus sp. TaxID=1971214 RepID=UPI003D8B99FD
MKKLYIQQKVFKITDHYPILDENDEVVYYVDQDFAFFGLNVTVSDKNHNEIFVITRELLHYLPEFVITFANGDVARLKSRFRLFYKKIDVIFPSMDISIEGDFLSHNFVIKNGDKEIGQMKRELFTIADRFEIEIYDEEYMDIIVAFMIAIDHLIDIARSAN